METKITDWLKSRGVVVSVLSLPQSTHTAQNAADAIGCRLGQIAKSIVLKDVVTSMPVLVIASGTNRLNIVLISHGLHTKLKVASPDYVLEKTGYSVGGVPPFAHRNPIKTYVDKDLLTFPTIWAAAGDSHSVFSLSSTLLIPLTKGELVTVC